MVPPGPWSLARRINNHGDAIGRIEEHLAEGMRVTHFIWSRATGMKIIGEIEYDWSAVVHANQSLAC
jgi:hypothetical protein